jgi:hypothetical protein
MTASPGTFTNRAYQLTSSTKILSDLFRCPVADAVLNLDLACEAENLGQFYWALKEIVQTLEESFDSTEEMADNGEFIEGDWLFTTDSPTAVANFAEVYKDDPITMESPVYAYFYEAVGLEFANNPRAYSRYCLDDVVEMEAPFYRIKPDPNGGAFFERRPAVIGQEVRAGADLNKTSLGESLADPWSSLEEADAPDEHY